MATKVRNRVAFIRMKSHPGTILESNMIQFPVDICPGRPTNCLKPGWNCESPLWKSLKSVSNLWEHSLILTRISSECLLSPWEHQMETIKLVSSTMNKMRVTCLAPAQELRTKLRLILSSILLEVP